MKREIKFRGLGVHSKDWFYGTYHYSLDDSLHYIVNREKFLLERGRPYLHNAEVNVVDKESIGQYSGLTDKNGKEVYEGDIMARKKDDFTTGDIQFSHGIFGIEWFRNKRHKDMIGSWGQLHNLRRLDDDLIQELIVIGNIYENPELLK